jgi:hypothetical protein
MPRHNLEGTQRIQRWQSPRHGAAKVFLKTNRRKHDSRDRWFAVYHSSATKPGCRVFPLLEAYFVCASRIDERVVSPPSAECQATGRRTWLAVCMLIGLVLASLLLPLLAAYTVDQQNQPGDGELVNNFLSHQAAFEELVEMLGFDCRALRRERRDVKNLEMLSRVVDSTGRMDIYRDLLQRISVADLRYFPNSGKLILLPIAAHRTAKGSSKSYEYLPEGRPDRFVQRHGYYWRGPGVYFLTDDRRIKGDWYIHHDMMITVSFSPY